MASAHSRFGMSGQSIIIACPGSVHAQKQINIEYDETPAITGNAIHQASEFVYRFGLDAIDVKNKTFNGVKIKASMIDAIDLYVQELRKLSQKFVYSYIEKRVHISSINAEKLFGTADYISINMFAKKLTVADLKAGYVSVNVSPEQFVYVRNTTIKGNAQTVGYLLGALDTFGLWEKTNQCEAVIIQPNREHVDGPVRTQSYTMEQMLDWWHVYRDTFELAVKTDAPRFAGKHCKYCKARVTCKTNLANIVDKLGVSENGTDIDDQALIALFDLKSTITSTLKWLDETMLDKARKGVQIPDYKLVRSYKRAEIKDETDLINDAVNQGVQEEKLYDKKLLAKTYMKELMGKDFVEKHYEKPEVSLRLVSMDESGAAQRPDKIQKDATNIFKPIQR